MATESTETTAPLSREDRDLVERMVIAQAAGAIPGWVAGRTIDDDAYWSVAEHVVRARPAHLDPARRVPEIPAEAPPATTYPPGLYRIFWKSGGSSLAAVGTGRDGTAWLAPVDWAEPAAGWWGVADAERVEVPRTAPPEPAGPFPREILAASTAEVAWRMLREAAERWHYRDRAVHWHRALAEKVEARGDDARPELLVRLARAALAVEAGDAERDCWPSIVDRIGMTPGIVREAGTCAAAIVLGEARRRWREAVNPGAPGTWGGAGPGLMGYQPGAVEADVGAGVEAALREVLAGPATGHEAAEEPCGEDAPLSAKDVIRRLCRLQERVADHVGHVHAHDCFCGEGGFWGARGYGGTHAEGYRNDGEALAFIERATEAAIKAEAAPSAPGFADAVFALADSIKAAGPHEGARLAEELRRVVSGQWPPRVGAEPVVGGLVVDVDLAEGDLGRRVLALVEAVDAVLVDHHAELHDIVDLPPGDPMARLRAAREALR